MSDPVSRMESGEESSVGMERRVLVFATSYLDLPVSERPDAGAGKETLDKIAREIGVRLEFKGDRDPAVPLSSDELKGAVAVIADLERYDRSLLEDVGSRRGGSLELIARYGVGVDSVDLSAARECGVTVTNTPGANSRPTAEWTVSTILDIAGRRTIHHSRAKEGLTKVGPSRLDVTGKRLGIVGTGAIGRTVAELMSGFGLKLCAYDPYPNREWAEVNDVTYMTLSKLLSSADLVTLHAATTDQIVGKDEIDLLGPSTVLVNCARGSLVDNRAAWQAVKEGRIWGYGLDERWPESDLPVDGLNIACSPHVGSDSENGKAAMQTMTAEQIRDFLLERTPEHIVNG